MRRSLAALAALLAGCADGPDLRPDDGPFTRPAPELRDYRRLAEEVVDGIAALNGRFAWLEGLSVPRASETPELALRHERAGSRLDVLITLGTGGEGLPYEIGRLRIFVKAAGPGADGLLETVRTGLDDRSSWFLSRFDPEERP